MSGSVHSSFSKGTGTSLQMSVDASDTSHESLIPRYKGDRADKCDHPAVSGRLAVIDRALDKLQQLNCDGDSGVGASNGTMGDTPPDGAYPLEAEAASTAETTGIDIHVPDGDAQQQRLSDPSSEVMMRLLQR